MSWSGTWPRSFLSGLSEASLRQYGEYHHCCYFQRNKRARRCSSVVCTRREHRLKVCLFIMGLEPHPRSRKVYQAQEHSTTGEKTDLGSGGAGRVAGTICRAAPRLKRRSGLLEYIRYGDGRTVGINFESRISNLARTHQPLLTKQFKLPTTSSPSPKPALCSSYLKPGQTD